jgi:hypothetical protein
MQTSLDIKAVIAHFGGRIELWRKMNARGHKLSVKTIEKWGERNNIPGPRISQLMDLALSLGKPLNLNKFILRTAPNSVEAISPNTDNEQKHQDV